MILCVKALPDVYDLASVIESVVAPQHTCILVNTTSSLGIETYLEQRFPTNVVLSLVSGAELVQQGPSEFEHKGSSELWVGAANGNPAIPASIQQDMAEALAMTLKSGAVDCEVSSNIRQQQFERMVGYASDPSPANTQTSADLSRPVAFHPLSVLFETPSHAELLEKTGVRSTITGVIDELLNLAHTQGCAFHPGFRERVTEQMISPSETNSIMYQDYTARRPMEVETYLGSPVKIAQDAGVAVPRIETLYALLHNINIVNQSRPQHHPGSLEGQHPPPRMSSAPNGVLPKGAMYGPGPAARPPMANGMRPGPGSRAPSAQGGPPPPGRRGPPSMNGYPPRMNGNGYAPRGPPPMQRRPSMEGNDLEEFSHLVLYDNIPEGDAGYDGMPSASGDMALREREMALRQKELALREQEFHMRRRGQSSAGRMHGGHAAFEDDDDEAGEDYFDPMAPQTGPPVDPESIDMMSVTSRRTRKAPSATQLRANPEMGGGMGQQQGMRQSRGWKRPPMKNRASTSASIVADMPGLHEQLMGNPLVGYSSDRYGNVDRMNMGHESRTNSLTAERLNEMQRHGPPGGGPPYAPQGGPPMSRRGSQSPGHPLAPNGRHMRPSPPNGFSPQSNGMPPNGRPSPPGMRQPVPRHPPGHGNAVAPQAVEQQAGVSRNPYPPKSGSQVRSLTGSASASARSGDSNRSAPLDSELSAHTSSSSLAPRPPIGVR